MRRRKADPRSGQTVIFFIMALVILVFVVMWNFDLHKILHAKSITQNAGDAAALMAARWQGISLNLMGDLNILQAVAIATGHGDDAASITNMQARLAFVGPMIAFMASQEAAKNNGIYRNPAYDELVRRHAQTVRNDYPTQIGTDGEPLFPEPYQGCWDDYADMLEAIADEGIAAGADNAQFYADHTGGHILLEPGFYEAVAGKLWCWFYHNAPTLLEYYTDHEFWDPLPEIPHMQFVNSEIYGLGLERRTLALGDLVDLDWLRDLASDRNLSTTISNTPDSVSWYCYNMDRWSAWDTMDPNTFPIIGDVKDQYDYIGADAAVRLEARTRRLTPGPDGEMVTNTITWTAAAKPFGYLNDEDRPNSFGLVLPAFHDVRLIPVDASTMPAGGSFNIDWRIHIEEHLRDYVATGVTEGGCWYCDQLNTWEPDSFRDEGRDWLAEFSDRCIAQGGSGGGGGGGGTRIGH